MFATSPQTPFRQTRHYTPTHPSPLGISAPQWTMTPPHTHNPNTNPIHFNIRTEPIPRHAQNHASPVPMPHVASASASTTPTSIFAPFASHPNAHPSSPTSPSRHPKSKYEARYAALSNPMKDAAGLARSKTRKMFLNRVKGERDAGRFEARGEQMMHMEHLADRRRWEESMAREGEGVIGEVEIAEEDDMLPDYGDALDEFISQEEALEMELREAQAQAQIGVHGSVERLRATGTGNEVPFSDDDYDDIFMGLQEQSQDMDMS